MYFWVLCLLTSSWHTRVLISAPGDCGRVLPLIFAHSSLLSAPLAQPAGWVLSLSLSVRPKLSACPLAWAPLALVCAVLVVLGASLRHLAGHLRADHWRQSLGSTVTSHSDHRRKEEEPLEGQEALLRREGLQKEALSEGAERRRGRSQLLGLKVFCSEGGHPETVCQHVNSCF